MKEDQHYDPVLEQALEYVKKRRLKRARVRRVIGRWRECQKMMEHMRLRKDGAFCSVHKEGFLST